MSQTFWKEIRKLNILDKLRNKITLPAFCARCGEDNGSINFGSQGFTNIASFNADAVSLTQAFTVEFWYKTVSTYATTKGVLFQNLTITIPTTYNVEVAFLARKVVVTVKKDGVLVSFTSSSNYMLGTWGHLAITFDGLVVKLYLDGVLDSTSLGIVSPLTTDGSNQYLKNLGSDTATGANKFFGKLAELRVWSLALSKSEIFYGKDKRRGKNSGLLQYFRLNSYTTVLGSKRFPDFLDPTNYIYIDNSATGVTADIVDYPPLITGASALAAIFDVVASQNISLKYPIRKPSDAEFSLCVSYVNDDNERIRYKLWDDVLDLVPSPIRYRGQVLPSSFRFEVFGRDGAETAELTEDLEIYFSKVSIPTTQRDTTNVNLVTNPTIDNSLACPWGSAFPLTFNTEQFGTCAAPVAQNLAVMSNNLTVYGGTGGVAGAILQEQGDFILTEEGEQIVSET